MTDAGAEEKPFYFFKTLGVIHASLTALDGYRPFLLRYVPLQIIRLLTALSPIVVITFIADDFDFEDITVEQHIVFAFLGALNVFGRLAPYATKFYIDQLKENLQVDQACAVVEKIFELPHSSVIATPTGRMAQLLGKVFRHFDQIIPAMYSSIFPIFAEVFFAFIFLSIFYSYLGLIQLVLFFLYTWISYRSAATKAKRNQELSKIMIEEWGNILAGANSYERAHLFGNVETQVAKVRVSFASISEKFKVLFSSQHSEAALLQFIGLFITGLFMGVVFFLYNQDLEVIELVAVAFYFVIFMGSLEQYANAISELRSAVFEYVSFQEFMDILSDVLDVEDAEDMPMSKNPSIEFKNVCFSYEGKDILDDISFKINGGETCGLVGPSGCGKSTITRLLLRFYKATSGIILVDGKDITKVKGKSLRRLFSAVTQDAQLFNGTVRDNIEYGKIGSTEEEIMEAARKAELTFGAGVGDISLDKEIGEKGAKLSGGQQQRVALARAMLKNGTIYILDEPTTGLDGVVAEQLQQTLDKLSSNATTICITHHLRDLKHADQILYLKEGKVVERGTFSQLVELHGEFSKQIDAGMMSSDAGSEV